MALGCHDGQAMMMYKTHLKKDVTIECVNDIRTS